MDSLFYTTGSLARRITIPEPGKSVLTKVMKQGGFYDRDGCSSSDINRATLLDMRSQIEKLLGDLDKTEELQSVRGVRIAVYERLHFLKGLFALPLVIVGALDIEDTLFLNPKVTTEHVDIRMTLERLLIDINNRLTAK